MQDINNILEVKNLSVQFAIDTRQAGIESNQTEIKLKAVDDISFVINQNESVGIVGESGSGKSVTAYSILKLIPSPPGEISNGEIWFKNKNLLKISDDELRKIRGKEISIIPQEPVNSLNPVLTIREQMVDAFLAHKNMTEKEAEAESIELLKQTGINDAEKFFNKYPHQFSGGMLQRVVISIAIANHPSLLIADEPTTSLDTVTQTKILNLIFDIKKINITSSLLFISHDLKIIKRMCDKVLVMYAGKIQETGKINEIYNTPKHPYTQGLFQASSFSKDETGNFRNIKGNVPELHNLPQGCRFSPRCPYAFDKCFVDEPELKGISETQKVRCHLY